MAKPANGNAELRTDLPWDEHCPSLRGLLPANGQHQRSAFDQPDAKESDGIDQVQGCVLRIAGFGLRD